MSAADIRVYLSGARAAGETQADSSRSLGGWRSSSPAQSLAQRLTYWIDGVRVLFISGTCGTGTHTIKVSAGDQLQFSADGDDFGPAVTASEGATLALYSDTDSYWALVKVETGADLSGECQIVTEPLEGGAVGMDVGYYGGASDYRMIVFKNETGSTINPVTVWVDSGSVGLAIALDSPDSTGYFRDAMLNGEATAPPGTLSFSTPTTSGAGLNFSLAAGALMGLWLRRTIAGSGTPAQLTQKIFYSFGGVTQQIYGMCRIGDTALVGYGLFKGEGDAEPDFSASPWQTFSALPHTSASLDPSEVYKLAVRRRNAFGMWSQNIESWRIELDGSSAIVAPAPSAPTEQSAESLAGGRVLFHAVYDPEIDGDNAANQWVIYIGVDGAPNLAGAASLSATIIATGGPQTLEVLGGPYDEGAEIRAVIRVRRTADGVKSTNTDEVTAEALAPLDAANQACNQIELLSPSKVTTLTGSGNNRIEVDEYREAIRFVLGGATVATLNRAGFTLMIGAPREGSVSHTPAAAVEVSSGTIYFSTGSPSLTTRASLNSSGVWTAASWREAASWPLGDWTHGAAYWGINGGGALEISADRKVVGMRVDTDGTLVLGRSRENG